MRDGRRRQRGISLVELMVSLTLGLLLGAAVVQIFLSSKQAYRMQDAISRLQESGRFGIETIARDARMAGYMGCASIDQISVNVLVSPKPADVEFTPRDIIRGLNDVAAANEYDAAEGTDVLIVRKASSGGAKLTGNLTAINANIQIVDNPHGFQSGDILFITDCVTADLFCANNVSTGANPVTISHPASCNSDVNLSKPYGEDSEVMAFESIAYFVRDTGRTTPAGNPISALWVKSRAAKSGTGALTAYELVEGVENMQVEFGVDTNNDRMADVYRTAGDITGSTWENVVSVRIALLMQSVEDNIVDGAGGNLVQNLEFNGQPVATDGRLRQVFSTVVAIRNRLP